MMGMHTIILRMAVREGPDYWRLGGSLGGCVDVANWGPVWCAWHYRYTSLPVHHDCHCLRSQLCCAGGLGGQGVAV